MLALALVYTSIIVAAGALSKALAAWGVSIPFTQSAATYALLFLAFLPIIHRKGWQQPLWKYSVLAGLDVGATWCTVKAYSLTSMTSVTLLDSWTVPCVMLLTFLLFRQRRAPSRMLR